MGFSDYEFRHFWRPGMRTKYVSSSLPFMLAAQAVETLRGREVRWTRAPRDDFFCLTRIVRRDGAISHGVDVRSGVPAWAHRLAFRMWEPCYRAGLRLWVAWAVALGWLRRTP